MNDTIMFNEIIGQVQNIEDCDTYNAESVKEIASNIASFKPQNIVIVGRGTSIHAGIYARYLFVKILSSACIDSITISIHCL